MRISIWGSSRKTFSFSRYTHRPYTLRLARGVPQLRFQVFDVAVLEAYRNDPRYKFTTDDVSGCILLRSGRDMANADKTSLQTFGFAFNNNGTRRAIAVFLRYLSRLSPRHQRIWHANEIRGKYGLHPDYFRRSILGQWYQGVSIFDAVIEELRCVDDMCWMIGWPALFKNSFADRNRPDGFNFLLRPTLKEFNTFMHLLDKMLSDNINAEFFRGQIAPETEQIRRDGKVEVRKKGTIQMLAEWISRRFKIADRTPIDEAIAAFQEVRKLRQKPAHAIEEDSFNQRYYQRQREIMARVYVAVQTLRLMLANHPKAARYQVSAVLTDGPIWMQ